ncbi:MAG: hypothetical protein JW940_36505 [Polyangiaceae bacterium]|nr:hypothetical protein [Polyangiaceae bacterium]
MTSHSNSRRPSAPLTRPLPRQRALPWIALTLATSTAACVSAQAEIPSLELTRENLTFPAAATELADELESMPEDARTNLALAAAPDDYHFPTVSFSYDRIPMARPPGVSSDVQAKEVTVAAHKGTDDLSFVRRIRLTVTRLGEDREEPEVLIDYSSSKASSKPIGRSLTTPVLGAQRSIDPWQTESSVYELDIWGDLEELPARPWTVDVSVVFGGSVSFEY